MAQLKKRVDHGTEWVVTLIENTIESGDDTVLKAELDRLPKDDDMKVAIGFSQIAQCEFTAFDQFLLYAEQEGLISPDYQLDAAERFHCGPANLN